MIIVTNQMFENQFLTGLQQNLQAELTDTQEISSGYKINQPSDGPAALVQIVGYQTQLSDITEYQKSMTAAKVPLQSLDSSLSNLNNALTRANELAISGVNATMNAGDLQDIAAEVQQLYTSAVSIANTSVSGQYIFAGDKSNVNPIDPNTGELISDNNPVNLNIGAGVNVTTNVSAGSLFSFQRVNGNADSASAILPTYNSPKNGATIPDADPVSALETTSGLPDSNVTPFTANGGTINITSGSGQSTGVSVTIAAGATLQDVRDDINSANAGVKAQVVNIGTNAAPDFRLVIASVPAGGSANIDISVSSTTDPSGTGINMLSRDKTTGDNMTLATNITNYNYITTQASGNNSIVIDDGTNGGVANNQIVFQENGGAKITARIARGTYTPDQLATAIGSALTKASGVGNTYTASYNPNTNKFTITNAAGNPDPLDLLWSSSSSTAGSLLGYNAVDDTVAAGSSDVGNNSVVANYYSFNNNYLNDKYILRALNFEQQSLQNNDSGRVQQAIKYTTDLSAAVSQVQAQVGSEEDKVNTQSSYQTSSQSDMQVFLSNAQNTDVASVGSDLTLRQTALQALRTVTTDVFSQSLFDFIKPS